MGSLEQRSPTFPPLWTSGDGGRGKDRMVLHKCVRPLLAQMEFHALIRSPFFPCYSTSALDFLAIFDTINHSILLDQLQGFQWVLMERDHIFSPSHVGMLFPPFPFNIYIKPLDKSICHFGVQYYLALHLNFEMHS